MHHSASQCATQFSMSCQSSRIQRVADEASLHQIDEDDFLSFVEMGFFQKTQSQMVTLDHQMEYQIFFHLATFCLPLCLDCFADNRNNSLLLFTICPKDLTEPEVQRFLLLLHRLRFLSFPLVSDRQTKGERRKLATVPERPRLRHDYRQFCGFVNGMFEQGQSLPLEDSGEWT